jgi:hypothetical protein
MSEQADKTADDQEHAPAKRDQPEPASGEDLDEDPAYSPEDENLKGIKGS